MYCVHKKTKGLYHYYVHMCIRMYVGVYEIYKDPVARQKHMQKLAEDNAKKGKYMYIQTYSYGIGI